MRKVGTLKGFTLYHNDNEGYTALARGQIWGDKTLEGLKKKIHKIGGSLNWQYQHKGRPSR